MKSTLDGINGRLDFEEKFSETEDVQIESINKTKVKQNETEKKG